MPNKIFKAGQIFRSSAPDLDPEISHVEWEILNSYSFEGPVVRETKRRKDNHPVLSRIRLTKDEDTLIAILHEAEAYCSFDPEEIIPKSISYNNIQGRYKL